MICLRRLYLDESGRADPGDVDNQEVVEHVFLDEPSQLEVPEVLFFGLLEQLVCLAVDLGVDVEDELCEEVEVVHAFLKHLVELSLAEVDDHLVGQQRSLESLLLAAAQVLPVFLFDDLPSRAATLM